MGDDGDDALTAEELVTGFAHLRGSSKSIDMVKLMVENQHVKNLLIGVCEELGLEPNVRSLDVKLHRKAGHIWWGGESQSPASKSRLRGKVSGISTFSSMSENRDI